MTGPGIDLGDVPTGPTMTWDHFERICPFTRPPGWEDRPDGPDALDLYVCNAWMAGFALTRREVLDWLRPDVAERWRST